MQVIVKNGVESELTQIFRTYEQLYPKKWRWFKDALRKLREVQKSPDGSWNDMKGRCWNVKFRVPTELWLFIQHRIPEFGRDYRDVELMLRVAKDFVATSRLQRKRIWDVGMSEEKEGTGGTERRDDRSRRRPGAQEVPEESRRSPTAT